MEDYLVRVKMLGGFSVYCGEIPIVTERSRNSKVVQLLEYLLVMRHRPVPQEELTEILLTDVDSDNLNNVLKNLVYRLRKLFLVDGVPDIEFIYYKKGCYGFSQEASTWVDVEQFTQVAEQVRDMNLPEERRLALCEEALSLYAGDFLPRLSGEPWAMVRTVQLQGIYRDCVQIAYDLLAEKGDFLRVLELVHKATTLYPYDEALHGLHISCLFELKRYKEALHEYEIVANMLMDELGIRPSQELQELYKSISQRMQPFTDSVMEIREDMSEEEYVDGAYYCNYYDFTSTYRFIVRHMERSGQSAFLMLCSMVPNDVATLANHKRVAELVSAFRQAAEDSLRRGDVYTRYSTSQFLLLLMDINQENCHLVAKRLRANFYNNYRGRNVTFYYKVISVADMDQVMEGGRIDGRSLRWGIDQVQDEGISVINKEKM
ncbi:hypothetical protein LJC20_01740 [Eubacteriales bacterium OttesenSCG-928-M02]|nr:hypothetical protein [Eubacteriales bacterium OttesenSCG-928-M02]